MSWVKLFGLSFFFGTLLACSSDSEDISSVDNTADAQYRITFTSNWNSTDFPTDYPSKAHFSGLVGGTHNDTISFWSAGTIASSGVKSVAETGSKSVFQAEIETAQGNGSAEYLLSGNGIGSGTGTTTLDFSVNKDHSRVALISMIAPSPDWFIGVHDLDLYDTVASDWKQSVTVELKAYDSGTDDGESFKSSNSASNPRQDIALLSSNPATDFTNGVHHNTAEHIATFTFDKI